MATRINETSKGIVKVVTATKADGTNTTASRIISHISPAATDAAVLSLCEKFGAMQTLTVDSISRQSSADLSN